MHIPVMVKQVIKFMAPKSKGIYLDATVGEGGHAKAILEASSPDGYLVCSDMDKEMLSIAEKNLEGFEGRVNFIHANYKDIDEIAKLSGVEGFDGILIDLGFNSSQIEDPDRGFSFFKEGPLDMRYDKTSKLNAYDVVNKFDKARLSEIIKEYGEERSYKRIAQAIVTARKSTPIKTTVELANIVSSVKKGSYGIHPATKTFQAIRIFVNNELENLSVFLKRVVNFLNTDGVLVIISFHSLEDRIVKHAFKQLSTLTKPVFKILTRKLVVPEEEEIVSNPRARSAGLRAIKRVA
ncbi:MAG: 16S rRNA (cytosine(1402)-N(4))-methyltransferase RsmH [bacterium]